MHRLEGLGDLRAGRRGAAEEVGEEAEMLQQARSRSKEEGRVLLAAVSDYAKRRSLFYDVPV